MSEKLHKRRKIKIFFIFSQKMFKKSLYFFIEINPKEMYTIHTTNYHQHWQVLYGIV